MKTHRIMKLLYLHWIGFIEATIECVLQFWLRLPPLMLLQHRWSVEKLLTNCVQIYEGNPFEKRFGFIFIDYPKMIIHSLKNLSEPTQDIRSQKAFQIQKSFTFIIISCKMERFQKILRNKSYAALYLKVIYFCVVSIYLNRNFFKILSFNFYFKCFLPDFHRLMTW